MKIKELYILRGLPGAGKSTLAKSLGGKHVEADMFHLDKDGNYNWKIDEGIAIRIRNTDEIFKLKSPNFIKMESDDQENEVEEKES